MELYLDSANLNEIEEGFQLGFLDGLTTTPTFMQREGIKDIDGMIVKLSKMVPVLQIEALGDSAESVLAEAQRQLDLGLDKDKTVFKIPVSWEGIRACKLLKSKGMRVNVHLVYTLQQAYMAMHAGADYVCVLAGRMQDQGHDALDLIAQCVDTVDRFNYDSKIMFSSVRHVEHVRNAINLGCQTITLPLKILKSVSMNHLTDIGTQQFIRDTRLMTKKVSDLSRDTNPIVGSDMTIGKAAVKISEFGFGAVTVTKPDGSLLGTFTDGDIRRQLIEGGEGILDRKLSELKFNAPITVPADALLNDALDIFRTRKVDNLVIVNEGKPVGMLDIQDIEKN